MQLFGVAVAFAIIILFSFKKVSLAYTMCAATVVMALTSGLPVAEAGGTVLKAFLHTTTVELALTVFAIGVFSTIMKETGYLDNMVQGLAGFLGNLKAAIMAAPALIGSMPVLGGAAVSAPLVDKLGDGLDLSPDTKAAINLVFRHGMFFIFPLSPTMILVANLIGVSVGTLISKLWVYGVGFWIAGYWLFLRNTGQPKTVEASPATDRDSACMLHGRQPAGAKVQGSRVHDSQAHDSQAHSSRVRDMWRFFRYGATLLIALVLSVVFKLSLWKSMMVGVALGLVMAYFEKTELPSVGTVIKGSNLPQVAAMFWIMAFKEFAAISPVFPALVDSATAHGIPHALLAVVFPLLFGYVSANHTTTTGCSSRC